MAKNKGKNNAGDMKGGGADAANMNNTQMQNKSGSDKKGGAQNKAGDRQEYK